MGHWFEKIAKKERKCNEIISNLSKKLLFFEFIAFIWILTTDFVFIHFIYQNPE